MNNNKDSSLALPPKKLAIYYGWPIAVNLAWTVAGAITVFNDYDIVVFGAGLEDPSHPQYASTKDIIDGTTADIYGYVDATLAEATFNTKVDNWSIMGGTNKKIKGIFCDQFGFDFGLTRPKQNAEIDYIHSKSLNAFVNAWIVDDVFQKINGPNGGKTHMTATDIYLAESYQIVNGEYQDSTFWKEKADKMQFYRQNGPGFSQMATISTWDTRPYDQSKWDYSYYSSALYGFDYAGFGEHFFSAPDALLPFRTRKPIDGTITIGSITEQTSGVFDRQTNTGIRVDTANHTVGTLLD